MIIDTSWEFCDNTDVSAAAGTALVGNVIDHSQMDLGEGTHLSMVINVSVPFASGGAATVAFQLVSDAQEAIATDNSATVHAFTKAFTIAELNSGRSIILRLPSGLPEAERYLGVIAVTAAATTTAGSINAFLTPDAQNTRAYPDAVN